MIILSGIIFLRIVDYIIISYISIKEKYYNERNDTNGPQKELVLHQNSAPPLYSSHEDQAAWRT